ncbi:hypothetical protein HN358_04285 [Candidatus Uhrbacteria bacterium]|nr:hypothetical protein [Candidatus Uhrbacteria bacterium]
MYEPNHPARILMRRARRWSIIAMTVHAIGLVIWSYAIGTPFELPQPEEIIWPITTRWWDILILPIAIHVFEHIRTFEIEKQAVIRKLFRVEVKYERHCHDVEKEMQNFNIISAFARMHPATSPWSYYRRLAWAPAQLVFLATGLSQGIMLGVVVAGSLYITMITGLLAVRQTIWIVRDTIPILGKIKDWIMERPSSFKLWLAGN